MLSFFLKCCEKGHFKTKCFNTRARAESKQPKLIRNGEMKNGGPEVPIPLFTCLSHTIFVFKGNKRFRDSHCF